MVKLELEINDINAILSVLVKQPYENVFTLINKIHQQVGPQVNKEPEPTE